MILAIVLIIDNLQDALTKRTSFKVLKFEHQPLKLVGSTKPLCILRISKATGFRFIGIIALNYRIQAASSGFISAVMRV